MQATLAPKPTSQSSATVRKKDLFLSLVGGGVRGALTVRPLLRLEALTGKLTRDIFRGGIAGTSTGADLAAGIACGIPMTEIAKMYRRTGEVFNHSPIEADALMAARGYKFDIENLYKLVDSVLGAQGRQTINSFPTLILIPVRGVDGHYWYLTQDKPGATKLTGNVSLIDAAVGSSAAPTYFQEYDIPGIGLVVDGGVGVAGNPCYKLANEAFRYNADKFHSDSSMLVSIGTGKSPAPGPPGHTLLSKIAWILDEMLDAPEAQAPELVRDNFPDLSFMDFDIPLLDKIDMADASQVPLLESYGEHLADQIDWPNQKDFLANIP